MYTSWIAAQNPAPAGPGSSTVGRLVMVLLVMGGAHICLADVVVGEFTTVAIANGSSPFDGEVVSGTWSYDTDACRLRHRA